MPFARSSKMTVKFLYGIGAFIIYILGNQNFVYHFTGFTGLNGHQCATKNICSDLFYLLH